jgi:hypothetical protein
VGGVKSPGIKERAIQYWTNVDAELGAKLRANLGQAPLSNAEAANKTEPGPSSAPFLHFYPGSAWCSTCTPSSTN